MASSIELEAKTIEKAVEKACDTFKIKPHLLDYTILSYGSSGIFGLGRTKKARIRVNLPSDASIPTADPEPAQAAGSDDVPEIKQTVKDMVAEAFDDKPVFTFPDEPVALGRNVLTRIVDAITSDASITVKEDEDRIIFYVKGGNSAVLIGKHGQTLEAIQALVERVVNKRNPDRIRIEVDVEGYLKNRKNNLQRQAARLAQKCRRIKKPVTLGFLSAYERRIVHLALKDNEFVRTQSHGEGFLRKLMIFPKHAHHYRNRRNG